MAEQRFCSMHVAGDVGERGPIGVAFYSDGSAYWETDLKQRRSMLFGFAEAGYTFVLYRAASQVPILFKGVGLKPEYTYYNSRFHHAAWKWAGRRPAAQFWCSRELAGKLEHDELGLALSLPLYPRPQVLTGSDPDHYDWKCDDHDRWECVECYAVRCAHVGWEYVHSLSRVLAGWGATATATLSGTALNVWKSLDHPADIGLADRRAVRLSRRAFYGGRTECFKYGRVAPLWTADISSAYAAAMVETPMPDPASLIRLVSLPADALPLESEGVADVVISVSACHVPPLPHSLAGARVYPVGRLRGTWTLLELRNAVRHGCAIERVYEVVYATRTMFPFNAYVSTLWALREAYRGRHDPRELVAKLLLNNLYGRLGSRDVPEREILKPAPPGWNTFNSRRPYDTYWNGTELYLGQVDDLRFARGWSNVLWAAQITSAVRVKLHNLMLLQGVDLAYCDTDSIFSTQPVQGVGEGLGQLKLQGQYQAAILCQPKLYALQNLEGEWQAKAKGVPPSLALRFLRGHDATKEKAVQLKEALRRGIEPGSWVPVSHERHSQLYRRQPRNPAALLDPMGSSDTDPLVAGPIIDYPLSTGRGA